MEHEVAETPKKIMMLNNGTKDLNKILTTGRTEKTNYGLRYQRGPSTGITTLSKEKLRVCSNTCVQRMCKVGFEEGLLLLWEARAYMDVLSEL